MCVLPCLNWLWEVPKHCQKSRLERGKRNGDLGVVLDPFIVPTVFRFLIDAGFKEDN